MAVVIGLACFFLVRHFRYLNKKRDDESIAKKKVADKKVAEAAQAAQGGAAEAGKAGYSGYQASDFSKDADASAPLLR